MSKEHLAELFRRVDIESPSRQLKDPLSHPLQLHGEAFGKSVEHSQIDAHAGLLHAEENRRKRQIDIRIDALDAGLFHLSLSAGTSA